MTGSNASGGWVATLDRGYSAIVKGMMGLAAVYVGLMMVVIIYYTTFRSLGWSYNPYSFVFIEYGFLYVLMLGCPWMVRQRAHVYIELLTAAMPEGARRILSRLICLTCAAVCAVLAVYTGLLAWEDYSWNRFDELRAQLDIPRWVPIIAMPFGFTFSAVEFLRFVLGGTVFHTGQAGVHE